MAFRYSSPEHEAIAIRGLGKAIQHPLGGEAVEQEVKIRAARPRSREESVAYRLGHIGAYTCTASR